MYIFPIDSLDEGCQKLCGYFFFSASEHGAFVRTKTRWLPLPLGLLLPGPVLSLHLAECDWVKQEPCLLGLCAQMGQPRCRWSSRPRWLRFTAGNHLRWPSRRDARDARMEVPGKQFGFPCSLISLFLRLNYFETLLPSFSLPHIPLI